MTTAEAVQTITAVEYPIIINIPPLNDGEKFVGIIVSADGQYRHALILLPGDAGPDTWEAQTAWAASVGGELPDRVEAALLFAVLRSEFKPEWYWIREQRAEDAVSAWGQGFGYGNQFYWFKDYDLRARAVRRLVI